MAHNLNESNGRVSLMLARDAAWHNLGTVVDGAQTAADTMALAGLTWEVVKRPMFSQWEALDGETTVYTEEPTFGIFRADTRQFLGSVGNQYTPIQNAFQFDFLDALMEADGAAHYTAAGALGNGERVWCQIDLGFTTEVVPGDTSVNKLTFVNSHDGSMAAKAFMTQTRVVCQNTLNLAERAAKDFLSVRHTKNAETRIHDARTLIEGARQTAKSLEEKLRILAGRRLTKDTRQDIIHRLFFNGKTLEQIDQDTRGKNLVANILERFDFNDDNAFPQLRDTPAALLNAIIEDADHFRPVRKTDAKSGWTTDQIRANNALFGTTAALKTQALELMLELTANAPSVGHTVYSVPTAPTPPPPTPGSGLLDSILTAYA